MYQELCAETHPYIIFCRPLARARSYNPTTKMRNRMNERQKRYLEQKTREKDAKKRHRTKRDRNRTECLMRQNTQTDAYTMRAACVIPAKQTLTHSLTRIALHSKVNHDKKKKVSSPTEYYLKLTISKGI